MIPFPDNNTPALMDTSAQINTSTPAQPQGGGGGRGGRGGRGGEEEEDELGCNTAGTKNFEPTPCVELKIILSSKFTCTWLVLKEALLSTTAPPILSLFWC
jgi:hypothetical protein